MADRPRAIRAAAPLARERAGRVEENDFLERVAACFAWESRRAPARTITAARVRRGTLPAVGRADIFAAPHVLGSWPLPLAFASTPRLAVLLGEGYRSAEHALKELIDNAWDADAASVNIRLPEIISGDPIVVSDNGTGMTEAEVRRDYLAVASSRQSRKGDHTIERHRTVKGRKGIGKFAGFVVAEEMILDTRCRGTRTRLVLRRTDL